MFFDLHCSVPASILNITGRAHRVLAEVNEKGNRAPQEGGAKAADEAGQNSRNVATGKKKTKNCSTSRVSSWSRCADRHTVCYLRMA